MSRVLASPSLVAVLLCLAAAARGDEPGFAGGWETTFGPMTLVADGEAVRGTYVMQGRACAIVGRVRGGTFTFKYREPAAAGEGAFTLAADGRSFSGRWREDGTAEWAGWSGTRVEAAAAEPFDGVWDGDFGPMRLVQAGTAVRGCYATDGGTIEGTIRGRRLDFKYREATAAGSGHFDLSADGRTLSGKWKPDGAADWSDWTVTRVDPEPGVVWLVVLEAQWEEGDLRQKEYAFGDMLRAFFAGRPQVQVRHRIFGDAGDVAKWCREAAFLPEPVVLVVASHGSPDGVAAGGTTVSPAEIAAALRYADNLRLLHFSACEVLKGPAADRIHAAVGDGVRFPISGYTTAVDWAGSAVAEFLYLELVLCRDVPPVRAVKEVGVLMPFTGAADLSGAPIRSLGLKIVPAGKR